MTDAKALAQAPSLLRDEARNHKRASAHHRREAKRLMQQAQQMEDALAQMGISVEYQQP